MPVAGYDCETTGTTVASDRIVSAAVVVRTADGATTTRTWLIDPGVEIPEQATAIHGISTEQVRAHGMRAVDALDQIASVLADNLASGVPLLIYNATFDLRILAAELTRHGLPGLDQRLGGPVKPVLDPLVIDRAADRFRKGGRRLPDLMEFYGLAPSLHLHDAGDDVVNTIAVLDAILGAYPTLPSNLDDLHEWQVAARGDWAKNYNAWLARQGRPATADPVWP